MGYDAALKYLQGLCRFGVNLGLGRITELLRRLGDPHRRLRVIHIGGTNGKGSTTAMVAAILQAAGYRVGAFTSPHLISYTERYVINGEAIGEGRLADLIWALRPELEAMVREGWEHPTEFEVCTAIAFLYFLEEGVDFLVLEVGMGGAIDSTNVVRPLVAVITNVSLDHIEYLGPTVVEIARVKAGIIKEGVPVVTGAQGAALEVIAGVAREKEAPLYLLGRDVTWRPVSFSLEGQIFDLTGLRGHYEELRLPLVGRHQLANAAAAVAAVELLAMDGHAAVTERAIREGLARTSWPGRFEVVSREPLVILDGAHNHEGARFLREALGQYLPERDVIFVIGMLGEKEREKVAQELAPAARAVVVTRPNSPRAGAWAELAEAVRPYCPAVEVVEDPWRAVGRALEMAGPRDAVVVTGSLYTVGEVRERFLKNRAPATKDR
jgi:dihydrofolate synthase/folylpolyglutamate synthase